MTAVNNCDNQSTLYSDLNGNAVLISPDNGISLYDATSTTQIRFYQVGINPPLSSLNATTLNFTDSLTFSASNISSNDGNLLCEGGGTAILKAYNDAILWSSDGSVELRPNDVAGDLIFTGTNLEFNTASGNSGKHLRIKVNGTYYKLRLEND
jgi:hypothetical protein